MIRYVLQTCGTAGEAVRALRRIPVRMSSDWKHSLRRLGRGRIEVKLGSS